MTSAFKASPKFESVAKFQCSGLLLEKVATTGLDVWESGKEVKGPYYKPSAVITASKRVSKETILTFWISIGSLFISQGLYFQCFGLIHVKNVNTFCMSTVMRKHV